MAAFVTSANRIADVRAVALWVGEGEIVERNDDGNEMMTAKELLGQSHRFQCCLGGS